MGTQSRTKITPTNIKMQNRNISLFFFLTLLTLTIKEAQQTPINSVRHSDSVTEEGLYQNLRNQSWYAGTDIHGNAQHENNEEIWFDMHFPKEPIASNFSLHINGKPYQPSEVLDFAKKIIKGSLDGTSLSEFTNEKHDIELQEISEIVEPMAFFLLMTPLLTILPLMLLPIILLSVVLPLFVFVPLTIFLPFIPILVFLPLIAGFSALGDFDSIATFDNITTSAPTVVSTIATTISNEIVNLPKSI